MENYMANVASGLPTVRKYSYSVMITDKVMAEIVVGAVLARQFTL
jgi:hypothetical protein